MPTEQETIEQEILRLHQRRKELQDKERLEKQAAVASMEWMKGKGVIYQENHFAPYGHIEYILRLLLTKAEAEPIERLVSVSGLTLRGNSAHYQYNLMLQKDEFGLYLSTCNPDLFIDLLEEVRPKVRKDDSFSKRAKVMAAIAGCIG